MVINHDGCIIQTLDELRAFGYIVATAAIESAGEEGPGAPAHYEHANAAVDRLIYAIPGAPEHMKEPKDHMTNSCEDPDD